MNDLLLLLYFLLLSLGLSVTWLKWIGEFVVVIKLFVIYCSVFFMSFSLGVGEEKNLKAFVKIINVVYQQTCIQFTCLAKQLTLLYP